MYKTSGYHHDQLVLEKCDLPQHLGVATTWKNRTPENRLKQAAKSRGKYIITTYKVPSKSL